MDKADGVTVALLRRKDLAYNGSCGTKQRNPNWHRYWNIEIDRKTNKEIATQMLRCEAPPGMMSKIAVVPLMRNIK